MPRHDVLNNEDQHAATERAKQAGMRSGELSQSTVLDICVELWWERWHQDNPEADALETATDPYMDLEQVHAIHARAAAYCYGEFLANWYETPLADMTEGCERWDADKELRDMDLHPEDHDNLKRLGANRSD